MSSYFKPKSLHSPLDLPKCCQVSVTAISSYTPHSASWNGLDGDFASINQMPGQDVKLRFQCLGWWMHSFFFYSSFFFRAFGCLDCWYRRGARMHSRRCKMGRFMARKTKTPLNLWNTLRPPSRLWPYPLSTSLVVISTKTMKWTLEGKIWQGSEIWPILPCGWIPSICCFATWMVVPDPPTLLESLTLTR